MSGQSRRPAQQSPTPEASAMDLGSAEDFGSNAAAQDAMAAAASPGGGPTTVPVIDQMEDAGDVKVTLAGGSALGIVEGDKVVMGFHRGRIMKVFGAGRSKAILYDTLSVKGDAVVHRGTAYSRERYQAENDKAQKGNAERDAQRDQDDEYGSRK